MLTDVRDVLDFLLDNGATKIYLVGGAVRDMMLNKHFNMGLAPHDLDFEVYGLDQDTLFSLLSQCGAVVSCGKAFEVLKLTTQNDCYDFSLPRREVSTGPGHGDFKVEAVPDMDTKEAVSRRNFTMNSIMMDVETGDFLDHFNGEKDIKNKMIKVTLPERYVEDPLRNLVGLQQLTRFGFDLYFPDLKTYQEAAKGYHALAPHRIWVEWEKVFSKGVEFKNFFSSMFALALFPIYPELAAMHRLKQDPQHHPEGPVCVHSELAANWMVRHCEENDITGDRRIVLVCAALLHDIGKPLTTEETPDGRITSKGHDKSAICHNGTVGPIVTFLQKIHMPEDLQIRICPLVKEHMVHVRGNKEKMSRAAVRRLSVRLKDATIEDLDLIIQADHAARPPKDDTHPCPELLEIAKELKLQLMAPKPIIGGKALIEKGVPPGPTMGHLIKLMYQKQLDGEFETESEGLKLLPEVLKDYANP